MSTQTEAEQKLAQILVEALDLEDIEAADIKPEAFLFGVGEADSLGLDSIDALEIALAISQNYGIQLKADDEKNKTVFTSLRTLTDYINSQSES